MRESRVHCSIIFAYFLTYPNISSRFKSPDIPSAFLSLFYRSNDSPRFAHSLACRPLWEHVEGEEGFFICQHKMGWLASFRVLSRRSEPRENITVPLFLFFLPCEKARSISDCIWLSISSPFQWRFPHRKQRAGSERPRLLRKCAQISARKITKSINTFHFRDVPFGLALNCKLRNAS